MKITCECGYSMIFETTEAALKAGWREPWRWLCPYCFLSKHTKKVLDELHTIDCIIEDFRNNIKNIP